ncbi:MAG: hypothetical protein MUF81_05220 [Verrucomicrobia bacterium]|nr:hypothetical protein [Verrucomicrobiota bacterium]
MAACTNDDADGEGLTDAYEVLVSKTDPNDPDTDYDGRSDYQELAQEGTGPLNVTSFTPVRLACFRFNDTNWLGECGQIPLASNNLQPVDAWITKGVQLTNAAAMLKYRTVEPDGKANINLRSGTVRFWFKPLWNSGTGTGAAAKLIEVGSQGDAETNGWWSLFVNAAGNQMNFVSQTNDMAKVTNLTAIVSFTSNRWCQIVLTYTNGAVALFTNGVLCASNNASLPYPPLATRTDGFTIGSNMVSDGQAKAVFEDLETFNYPLPANDIVENYELTRPPNLIPNLRLWLKADAGVQTNAAGKVNPWTDQSGNMNDASQNTDVNRPFYSANGIAEKSAIYFPGTNNYFNLPSTLFNNATEGEAFALLTADSTSPTNTRALWLIGPQGSSYPHTDGTVADSFGSLGIVNTPVPANSIDQAHIYNVVARSNEWTCRLNGVTHFSRNNNTLSFSSSPVWLGAGGNGHYFAGYMGEILMYSRALSVRERLAVESYLSQRFSLVTDTPPVAANLAIWAVSTNQISLTWSNAISNTNLTFIVERRTAGESFTDVAFVRNGLSYLDSDLALGTQYYYRIKSLNYSGQSALSAETNVTTLSSGAEIPLASLKLWLKAGCGHGYGPVNCWEDQTTNNNSPYFSTSVANGATKWAGFNTNGDPAVFFEGTNAFLLPPFLSSATQAEAMVAVRSFGSTATNWVALWLMGGGATECRYPYTNNYIGDNFGRHTTNGAAFFSSGLADMSVLHLYNPMSKAGEWSARVNHMLRHTTAINNPAFQPNNCRLGRGDSTISKYLVGEISELMIFNRELTAAERDTVTTNYFRMRFNLW